jgi:hypothetical protein
MTNEEFITYLVQQVPALGAIYKSHVTDNDSILPHVFMGDASRYVISELQSGDRVGVLAHLFKLLEAGLDSDANVVELICVSFIENFIGEEGAIKRLGPFCGPKLGFEFKQICGVDPRDV